MKRRRFLKQTTVAAAGVAAVTLDSVFAHPHSQSNPKGRWSPKTSDNVGSVDDFTLAWLAQLGHECVVLQGTNWVDRVGKGYWTPADIEPVQERCRKFGLELHSMMIPKAWLIPTMVAAPDRDKWIHHIRRSIRAAGNCGVRMLEWRWSPESGGEEEIGLAYNHVGRGGAIYKSFDYEKVRDKPPFPEFGTISRDEMWERLLYFCGPVMEAAEEAGVKLSLHPKDPPVKQMRGIHRVLTNTEEMEAFLDAVGSPANGITFCQGTVQEMGVDVIDAIRRIGGRGRIHHVHFRTLRGKVPQYVETFIDEGDVDMLEAMRAYKEVNYTGSFVCDHTPHMTGDLPHGNMGRSFAYGYIRGLIQAVNAET